IILDGGAVVQRDQPLDVVRCRRDFIVETEGHISLFEKVLSGQVVDNEKDYDRGCDGPSSKPIGEGAGEHDEDRKKDDKAGSSRKLEDRIVLEHAEYEDNDKDQDLYGDEVKMILVEYLDDGGTVIEAVIFHLFDSESVEKIVDTNLLLAGNVEFFHCTCPRHLYLLFEFLVDATDDVFEDVLVGKPEVCEEGERHDDEAGKKTDDVHGYEPGRRIFIVALKGNDLRDVRDKEYCRDKAVVDA